MAYVHLITGGERSGKSTYAEKLALQNSDNPIYVATARVWDEEFAERIRLHQKRRGACWENIEEKKYLSKHNYVGRTVLIDCVTLWATNFFFDNDSDLDDSLTALQDEFDELLKQDAHFIIVTNEIGLGGVSTNAIQRRFTDLQGWFNQYIAKYANQVTLMVCGIPMKVK